jgi:hypothetical protein
MFADRLILSLGLRKQGLVCLFGQFDTALYQI